ncbi:MAG: altronate hydrolase [Chloroflexi bacterium]|nr:MAG: altronate hydrolase [Chloroflexota bacterium]
MLRSGGTPFGEALVDIAPGDTVCNANVLKEITGRGRGLELPKSPNFADQLARYQFDEKAFLPAASLPRYAELRTFLGYRRPGQRGVGTRNTVVLLGTNALVAGYVRQLENLVQSQASDFANIDNIVAVAHTEGSQKYGNNQHHVLRTLAGWIVHPNIGAVLIVDAGETGVNNQILQAYLRENDYPLGDVIHQFFSLRASFASDLEEGARFVTNLLARANESSRTAEPLGELKIALQCGGSDAFSGISGNPLAAWVAKEIIQYGGAANLAETDELVGAEAYVLNKVRDAATIQHFLSQSDRFKTRVGWHGYSVKGNPSGGNLYRGLYNIYLKSLGAAAKRHPDVRLDQAIEYGQLMTEPGCYFMDSPGNDLESIAGQVAAGCNLIFFVTGNGSITNFPFVPTIKIVTTTARYNLLSAEMDVNAGAYLDGMPLAALGQQTLDLAVDVASGQLSVGEQAGHAQVQIWRDWPLSQPVELIQIAAQPSPNGKPLPIRIDKHVSDVHFDAWQTEHGVATEQVGLVLPTSLCSGQIARLAVERLNEMETADGRRFVSLVHTEGCGVSTQPEFVQAVLGYATHPMVGACLLLEHGCEMTHNSFWKEQMAADGIDPLKFGWASVQWNGGIEKSLTKVADWFAQQASQASTPQRIQVGLDHVRLGVMTDGVVAAETAVTLAHLTQMIVAAGGTVVIPEHDGVLATSAFVKKVLGETAVKPTLTFAQQSTIPGCHVMANPSTQWTETVTGLCATGVEVVLALVNGRPQIGNPLVPVVQVTGETAVYDQYTADLDMLLTGNEQQLLDLLLNTLSRETTPRISQHQNVDFQITRGQLGISF